MEKMCKKLKEKKNSENLGQKIRQKKRFDFFSRNWGKNGVFETEKV